ncbi:hypothetical protein [Sphingomonas xinjiangensis]|uniref:Uncharacterized protein n=1 Tax=Sphingomonas xinjiangensis TaxID=643568 RepID=A0A840YTL5_9SPHN|nr:hypothetical protein [Sphingomonas xinjiangensis]MBB5712992.1 hypothetical protein [Sphingomonas xinjiangensis]
MSKITGAESALAHDYVRALEEHVVETKRTLVTLPNVSGTDIKDILASLDASYQRVYRAEERRRLLRGHLIISNQQRGIC